MHNKDTIEIAIVGDTGDNSVLSQIPLVAGEKKTKGSTNQLYCIDSSKISTKYKYTCYDIQGPIDSVLSTVYLKRANYVFLVLKKSDENSYSALQSNLEEIKKVNPKATVIFVTNSIGLQENISVVNESDINNFARKNNLISINVADSSSTNSLFKHVAKLENNKDMPDKPFCYSQQTKSALENINKYNDDDELENNLKFIVQQIEAEKNMEKPRNLYDDDIVKTSLQFLQYVSVIKSLENVITNALLILFIVVTFPVINYLYEKNLKERGDKRLFWADAPKQAAEVAINLANEDLKHKKSI